MLPDRPVRRVRWLSGLVLAVTFLAGIFAGAGLTRSQLALAPRLPPEPPGPPVFPYRELGLNPEQEARVREVLQEAGLEPLDLANLNAPEQQVLSGPIEALARAEDLFTRAGARGFKRLPVSAAFHSRYIRDARQEF